jgi:large subunit ribosomal protein L18
MKLNKFYNRKIRRAKRTRAKISGTAERPRLAVFRSNRTMYAQLIDDSVGKTLAAASSSDLKDKKVKTDGAKFVGETIAKKAKELGVTAAIFDKRSYRYHGRVKALAEAAREAGLKI